MLFLCSGSCENSILLLFLFPCFSSDNNVSEDDINDCEKEDPLDENDSAPLPDSMAKGKVKKKDSRLRWVEEAGAVRICW